MLQVYGEYCKKNIFQEKRDDEHIQYLHGSYHVLAWRDIEGLVLGLIGLVFHQFSQHVAC